MIFGEERKTLIPQMKRMVGAGSISPTGKRNSTEFQSRLLGSHVHHSQNYRNFSNVKNPWRAACGVQPTFFKPQTLSGIPTHPLLSAKIIPKAPKGQAKANRRVREGPLFPRDLCSSVSPLCPESGSFLGGASGKEPACQCRRRKRWGFNPWIGKILWRRAWQPTPVFLPGEIRGTEESGVVHGVTESDTTEQLSTCTPGASSTRPAPRPTVAPSPHKHCALREPSIWFTI